MEIEVEPDPPAEELEALDEAVRRLLPKPQGPRSAWWREGIRENVLDGRLEREPETER